MSDNQLQPSFVIKKIYVKDATFNAKKDIHTVFSKEWRPNLEASFNVHHNKLEHDDHEVVLNVKVNVTSSDEHIFEIEINQAGIFSMINMDGDRVEHAKYSHCPHLLYPYARASITTMVEKAGFPQLCLSAVNFDALYQNRRNQIENNKSQHNS